MTELQSQHGLDHMAHNNVKEQLKTLANMPAELRRFANGLSDEEARWKPESGEFSVVENVCHLRDLEKEGYSVRITRILSEDQPFLTDFDGARVAAQRHYNNQELMAALDDFAQARANNVLTIQNLSAEQLSRTGELEHTGTVTLEELIAMMRNHDDAHILELETLIVNLSHPT